MQWLGGRFESDRRRISRSSTIVSPPVPSDLAGSPDKRRRARSGLPPVSGARAQSHILRAERGAMSERIASKFERKEMRIS